MLELLHLVAVGFGYPKRRNVQAWSVKELSVAKLSCEEPPSKGPLHRVRNVILVCQQRSK